MPISRRNFLQSAGSAAAIVISTGGLRVFGQQRPEGFFSLPSEVYSESIFALTARQAEALIGTTFAVTPTEGRTVHLTLSGVNPIERKPNAIQGYYGECFSLIFEGQQRSKLNQGIYRVTGGGLDMDSVLLVPTGIDRNQYELIVNHLTR